MWINTACFVVGILFCQQLVVLPDIYWLILCLPFFYLAVWRFDKNPFFSALSFGLLGFCWAVIAAHVALQDRLSAPLVKKEIVVTGVVSDLPRQSADSWRFELTPIKASYAGRQVAIPQKLRLSWYYSDVILRSGQTWQLTVSLKPPVGKLNPDGFDYETWLFQQGIGAVGYVKNNRNNKLISAAHITSGVDVIREKISYGIRKYGDYPAAVALLQALSIGDKALISQDMWTVFSRLGINHLVAISGLHIGLVAMGTFLLTGILWRCSARLCLWLPAPHAQAIVAIFTAAGYSAMAGFSIPTQRAMIMLFVIMAGRLLLKHMPSGQQLSIAAFLILLFDPVSVISPGFWLSFVAVAAIYVALSSANQQISGIKKLIKVQWLITLFLMPLTLFFFKQASLISPLVNLLLIPIFSFLVVPIALLVSLLNLLDSVTIQFITKHFLQAISLGYQLLESLSSYPKIVYSDAGFGLINLVLLLLPILTWVLSTRVWHKMVSIVLLVGILVWKDKQAVDTNFRMTVLDVGQGLSVFIQQGERTLLYDLGPRYGQSGSATESIVMPYLKSRGVNELDYLIISHFDNDHAGDLDVVLQTVNVKQLLSGEKHPIHKTSPCLAGDQWQWDQAVFTILSPAHEHLDGNNASCVLKISLPHASILLTGDIEKQVEKFLLQTRPEDVKADIVIIPHHGSKSSSTMAFTHAVKPVYTINSSGYLNRYDFPNEQVRSRWLATGSSFLDTAAEGAIELNFDEKGQLVNVVSTREQNWRYWYWQRLSD